MFKKKNQTTKKPQIKKVLPLTETTKSHIILRFKNFTALEPYQLRLTVAYADNTEWLSILESESKKLNELYDGDLDYEQTIACLEEKYPNDFDGIGGIMITDVVSKSYAFIFLKFANINTITHEVVHVVNYLAESRGITDYNEFFAYNVGYLSGLICDLLSSQLTKEDGTYISDTTEAIRKKQIKEAEKELKQKEQVKNVKH